MGVIFSAVVTVGDGGWIPPIHGEEFFAWGTDIRRGDRLFWWIPPLTHDGVHLLVQGVHGGVQFGSIDIESHEQIKVLQSTCES